MPLISVNIKDSGGLASHANNVTKNIARAYRARNFSDLSFICRYLLIIHDYDINIQVFTRWGHVVQCHQSMLESLSPRLREMFQVWIRCRITFCYIYFDCLFLYTPTISIIISIISIFNQSCLTHEEGLKDARNHFLNLNYYINEGKNDMFHVLGSQLLQLQWIILWSQRTCSYSPARRVQGHPDHHAGHHLHWQLPCLLFIKINSWEVGGSSQQLYKLFY